MIRLFNVESVADAAVNAEEARARLSATLSELQARIAPSTLANDAIDEIRSRSMELADGATQLARRNPVAVAGAVAAGGLFLARKPVWGLLRRITGNKKARPDVVDPNREDAKPWIERTSG
jgi:ElaB/YqjD/DUF883 family membrane-anchored ribosome-binding protein